MSTPTPTDARLSDDHTLTIEWSDGRTLAYPLDALRAACPCAECVDEWTGEVRVRRDMFPGISLQALDEVGRYAFQITFTDGHGLGLFTWSRLLELGTPGAQ